MMKRFWVGGLTIILSCIYSAILWYLQEHDVNVKSGAWWFGNSFIALVGLLVGVVRERPRTVDQQRVDFCRKALTQIKKDRANFESIAEDRYGRYKSSGHRQAVEVASFEIVKDRISPLRKYWTYRSLIKACVKEIDSNAGKERKDMETARLVQLRNRLESKLKKELGNE